MVSDIERGSLASAGNQNNKHNTIMKNLSQELQVMLSFALGRVDWNQFGTSLKWEDSGKERLQSIAGWIYGLYDCGQIEKAQNAAFSIVEELRRLGNFGGMIEMKVQPSDGLLPVENTYQQPAYVVKIADDLSLFSFSLLWYAVGEPCSVFDKPGEREIHFSYHRNHKYHFHFNGGLIFHGRKYGYDGINTKLKLDRSWSIHT